MHAAEPNLREPDRRAGNPREQGLGTWRGRFAKLLMIVSFHGFKRAVDSAGVVEWRRRQHRMDLLRKGA